MINKLIHLEKVSIKRSNLNTIDKVFFDFKNLKEIVLNYNLNLAELKQINLKIYPN
jgi:hypothetical protein